MRRYAIPAWKKRAQDAFREAFYTLYEDNPVNRISVSALCAEAGYSRGAFYSYYTDIYDLLEVLELALLDDLGPIYALKQDADSLARLRAGNVPDNCVDWFRKCYANKRFLYSLIGKHGDPAFQFKLKKSLRESLRRVAMFDGVQDDDRTRALMEYQLSGIIGVLIYYFEHEEVFDAEEASEVVNTMRKRWILAKSSVNRT